MKLPEFIYLFLSYAILTHSASIFQQNVRNEVDSSIECIFELDEDNNYRCNLQIYNPNGENFTTIEGQHLEDNTDEDVQFVTIFWQNTLEIPAILCKTFQNIREITVMESNVNILEERSFENCRYLEKVSITKNMITTVPANLFLHSPRLIDVDLSFNNISQINQEAFSGTIVRNLGLAENFISNIDSEWFYPISKTLDNLDMIGNMIGHLSDGTFSSLTNLEQLMLGRNRITMDSNPFEGLESLKILFLGNNGFGELNPSWFEPITQLNELSLCRNEITELPSGIFSHFTNLTLLRLNNNLLRTVRAESFGPSIGTLRNLQFLFNSIESIDPQLLNSAVNLDVLMLDGNVCVDETFVDVKYNIEEVNNALQTCHINFDREPKIECIFGLIEDDHYSCNLRIYNPEDEDFQTIAGQHIEDKSDDDVQFVTIFWQNTRVIPTILCRNFQNIREITVMESNVNILEERSFEKCRYIEKVRITKNMITTVPANLFLHSPRLTDVDFSFNYISQIHREAFSGTIVRNLWLGDNFISSFDSEWFYPISKTLVNLDFIRNMIAHLPDGIFSNLTNLERLILTRNHIEMDDNPFEGLGNLKILNIGDNGLQFFNPSWFSPLVNLQELFSGHNAVTDLPGEIFSALRNLTFIRLNHNLLTTVRAESFGQSIENLREFHLMFNSIEFFDSELLDNAANLDILTLEGNVCIDENFREVANNTEYVMRQLQSCFDSA